MEIVNLFGEIEKPIIRGPITYTGSKFRLLEQLLPLLPKDIDTFYDVFCGSCTVGLNAKSNKVVYNDLEEHLIDMYSYIITHDIDKFISRLKELISIYNQQTPNQEGYNKLREYFNSLSKDNDDYAICFYLLICTSFSNQIRFNSRGEFNMPFGNRTFQNVNEENLRTFYREITNRESMFTNKSFNETLASDFNQNDFIYCDPPYLIATASYNENSKDGGWDTNKEKQLLELLDTLNDNNIKFGLSNVISHKGRTNELLKEWSNKYTTYHLNMSYKACSYHGKDTDKLTDEVFICNY